MFDEPSVTETAAGRGLREYKVETLLGTHKSLSESPIRSISGSWENMRYKAISKELKRRARESR